MRETTDTRFKIAPAGTWAMTATKPCIKKLSVKNNAYYTFHFEFMNNGSFENHQEIIFPSQSAMILRALQCKETEAGVFDWDKEEIVGRKITATIVHEADKKDSSKIRAKISSAEPIKDEVIPF